jgi:hypothetical protein
MVMYLLNDMPRCQTMAIRLYARKAEPKVWAQSKATDGNGKTNSDAMLASAYLDVMIRLP